MRKSFCAATIVLMTCSISLVAAAQEEPGSASLGFTQVITKQASIVTTPTTTTATLSALADDPRLAGRDLSDVQISGSLVPSLPSSQGRRVMITWTDVTRVSNPTTRRVLAEPLETEIIVGGDTTEIPELQELNAAGNTESVVAAVIELLDDEGLEEETAVPDQEGAAETSNTSSQGTAPVASGSRESDTSDAFSTPDPVISQEAPTIEQVPIVAFTTEGCTPRLDEAQGVVIVTEQMVTDGVPSGTCEDTIDRLTIQSDYGICPNDIIDMDNKTATASYRRYYIDLQAAVQYLDSQCIADASLVFDIVEEADTCDWTLDDDAKTATKLVRQIYTNQSNQRVELTSCLPSEQIAPIATTENLLSCEYRHDFTAGKSFETSRTEWTYNGALNTDGLCQDTGRSFTHFEESAGCSWDYNLDTNEAYATSRTAITVDGQTVLIDQVCGPDASTAVGLYDTADGCTGNYVDNFANQETYATSRTYYDRPSGERIFVTSCTMDLTTVFAHQSRIASYTHDDTARTSTPLVEIYIDTPDGENVRSSAQARDGWTDVPYVYSGETTIEDSVSYNGCEKTTSTILVEQYTRADNTVYNVQTGPGAVIGPVNSCSLVITTPVWTPVSNSYSRYSSTGSYAGTTADTNIACYNTNWTSVTTTTYSGYRVLQRDDGASITQYSKNSNYATFTATASSSPPVYSRYCGGTTENYPSYPAPSNPYSGSSQTSWNQAEGW